MPFFCGHSLLLHIHLGGCQLPWQKMVMKEYTLLAFFSVIITILLDRISGINVLRRRMFYLFFAIILCFKFFVNGYLTRFIVMYNPQQFLGCRIGTIPLEDFLFGFSMVTMSIIFWEYFKEKDRATPGATRKNTR
jgi:lycopene cyclase domain-containing protein